MNNLPTYKWECNRCGLCCVKTLHDTPLGKAGVFIMPEERKLFPYILVKPYLGVGVKGRTRPRPSTIFAYQMIGQPCPHYDEKERICRIYEYRPLTCKCFPISGTIKDVVLHAECPPMGAILKSVTSLRLDQLKGIEDCLKAQKSVNTYFRLVYMVNVFEADLRYAWFYDIDLKCWTLPTDTQFAEALRQGRNKQTRLG